jgi:hypothetical protein
VADAAVGRLVVEIQAGVDELVDGIVARIRAELPDFRRLPASTLARAVRGNVTRALAALAELRPPTAAELEGAAAVGRERAEQGLSVDGVLHAYRISIVWAAKHSQAPRTLDGRPDPSPPAQRSCR